MFRSLGAAIVALSCMQAASGQDVRFQIIDLGSVPDMTAATAFGINRNGIAAGQVMTRTGGTFGDTFVHAATFGGAVDLLPDAGSHPDERATAYDLNTLGVVGGYYYGRNALQRPIVWKDGGIYYLPMLGGGDQGEVHGISDSIDWVAVGWTSTRLPDGTMTNRAVMWDRTLGAPTALGTLDPSGYYDLSVARDVNAARQVVGGAFNASGRLHAFLWEPGTGMSDLGVPAGASTSEAKAVNELGHVAGNCDAYPAGAFYYAPETGINLIPNGYEAWGINNSDVVVGLHYPTGRAGVCFAPGQPMLNLQTLLEPASAGWTLYAAYDVNDRWMIVGSGRNAAGQSRAYMAVPIPVNPGPNQLAEAAGRFAAPGDMAGWHPAGPGSAETVTDPADPNNVVMSLTTGSPILIEQFIDTPDAAFAVGFDFRFLTATGTLTVALAGVELASIPAPADLMPAFTPYSMIVDDPTLRGLSGASFTFALDGPTGSRVLLDNIAVRSVVAVPEPAAAALLLVGLLAVARRR